jgi:peptide/nickel transport system permease protein
MLAFVLRRLFQSLIVMLAVALIAFTMFRFVGDPVNQMVGVDTPQEQVAQLRQTLGLDEPVVVQFARYIYNASSACR